MQSKCRDIFDSRMTYRQYMPVDDNTAAPNTWLLSWPKFGHILVNFLEVILYARNGHEEFFAPPGRQVQQHARGNYIVEASVPVHRGHIHRVDARGRTLGAKQGDSGRWQRVRRPGGIPC
jgi:hypothetical protein